MKTLVRILGIIALLGAAIVLLASVTALGSPDTFGAFLVAAIGLGLAGGLSLLAAQAVELLQQIAGGIAGLQAQAARAAAGPAAGGEAPLASPFTYADGTPAQPSATGVDSWLPFVGQLVEIRGIERAPLVATLRAIEAPRGFVERRILITHNGIDRWVECRKISGLAPAASAGEGAA